jgi:hypothetical protein
MTAALDQLQADRGALVDLVARLELWLDGQRYDEADTIFTEDAAVHTQGGQSQGLEALTAQARRIHADFAATQHLTSGVVADIDGDHATVRANLVAIFVREAGTCEPAFAVGELYRFEAVRTSAGWRLSRVEVTPIWRSGNVPRPN